MDTRTLFDLRNRWPRLLIAASVILLSALIPFAASAKLMMLFLLFILGCTAVLILWRWPAFGLAAILIVSMALKFSVGTGTQTRLHAGVLLMGLVLGLWFFRMFAYDRKIRLAPSRTVLPLIVFSAVVLLSFGFGQLPWFNAALKASLTAQLGGTALFLLSFGAYLYVGNQVHRVGWLELLTWIFLVIGGVYILTQLLPPLKETGLSVFPTGLTSSSIFWIWIVALSFSQGFFNQSLNPVLRMGLLGLGLATFAVSIGLNRDWTSGWLPAVIAFGVILFASGSRWALVVFFAGGLGVLLKINSVMSFIMANNQYSQSTRLAAWQIVLQIIQVNPILGLGPSNYYWYTQLFPILGYYVVFNSHNNYLDILAQTGILGLICFLWFGWEAWRLGWQLRSRVAPGFERAYVYGALGGLVGMFAACMLGDWTLPFIYNIGYEGFRASLLGWIFLGGLLALEQIGIRRENGAEG